MHMRRASRGFTLIEILAAVAVVAVVAAAVMFSANPAERFKQARDATRVTDLAVIDLALAEYETRAGRAGTGAASTLYVSIPDNSANCGTYLASLPALPPGWTYHCSPPSDYRKIDGAGWIPVDFTKIPGSRSFGALPIDPVNAVASEQYYTYATGGSWELTAVFESEKNAGKGVTDGGYDPAMYEMGTNLALTPFAHRMIRYWKLDEFAEQAGSVFKDSSGWGDHASHIPLTDSIPISSVAGKIGSALSLAPTIAGENPQWEDSLTLGIQGNPANLLDFGQPFTVMSWFEKNSGNPGPIVSNLHGSFTGLYAGANPGEILFRYECQATGQSTLVTAPKSAPQNGFHLYALTRNTGGVMRMYDNAQLAKEQTVPVCPPDPSSVHMGESESAKALDARTYKGSIDEVRIYARALPEAVIKAYYKETAPGQGVAASPPSQQPVYHMLASCVADPPVPRVGDTVTWSTQITGGVSPYNVSWTGSSGLSAAGQSVIKTYNTDNTTEDATVTVTSADGQTKTATCNINVRNTLTDPNNIAPDLAASPGLCPLDFSAGGEVIVFQFGEHLNPPNLCDTSNGLGCSPFGGGFIGSGFSNTLPAGMYSIRAFLYDGSATRAADPAEPDERAIFQMRTDPSGTDLVVGQTVSSIDLADNVRSAATVFSTMFELSQPVSQFDINFRALNARYAEIGDDPTSPDNKLTLGCVLIREEPPISP